MPNGCQRPGTPDSFTRKLISSSSFHRLDMTLAVAEALNPNKPNLDMTLAVAEALNPNKPNLNMTLAVAEALNPNKPNLDMTLAVAEALNPNKPNLDMTLAVAEALNPNKQTNGCQRQTINNRAIFFKATFPKAKMCFSSIHVYLTVYSGPRPTLTFPPVPHCTHLRVSPSALLDA